MTNAWTFISDFLTVKTTVRFSKCLRKDYFNICFCFQIVIAMLMALQVWFATRQAENAPANQMWLEGNVMFVKMDSKIILIAQVILLDSINLD